MTEHNPEGVSGRAATERGDRVGAMSDSAAIADTPEPPYYAVIFTSLRTDGDRGYGAMSERMLELAAQQEGFLGVESAREDVGITVSYWASLEAIRKWKADVEHREAQRLGRDLWYSAYRVRITKVEREYGYGPL